MVSAHFVSLLDAEVLHYGGDRDCSLQKGSH